NGGWTTGGVEQREDRENEENKPHIGDRATIAVSVGPRTGDRDSDGIWWTANGGADIPVDGLTRSDTGTCTDQRATAWIRRVNVCGKLRGLECDQKRMLRRFRAFARRHRFGADAGA